MKRGLILSTLILLILGGCVNPITDFAVFNAYRGVNLMAGVEFQIDPINGWEESSSAGVLFFETTDLGNVGPNLEPAVSLESLNQLVDGHFPNPPGGLPNFWLESPPPAIPPVPSNTITISPVVDGGIAFTRQDQTQFISLDLTDTNNLTSFAENRPFTITIDFNFGVSSDKPNGFMGVLPIQNLLDDNYRFNEGIGGIISQQFPTGARHTFRANGVQPRTDLERLIIGGEVGVTTNIHSVRIVENEPDKYFIETRLNKVPGNHGLALPEQGRFEFGFFARKETGLSGNRFHAQYITVELLGLDSSGNVYRRELAVGNVSDANDGSWGVQRRISVRNPIGTEIRSLNDNDPALIIRIYPFDRSFPDAGTIELSNPSLEFFPN